MNTPKPERRHELTASVWMYVNSDSLLREADENGGAVNCVNRVTRLCGAPRPCFRLFTASGTDWDDRPNKNFRASLEDRALPIVISR